MAENSPPWRDPNNWAKLCEMARELLTAADDIAAGVADDSQEATILTRWPADKLSVAMNTLADLLAPTKTCCASPKTSTMPTNCSLRLRAWDSRASSARSVQHPM